MSDKYIYVASFDIGQYNFAHYIERVKKSKVDRLTEMYKTCSPVDKKKIGGEWSSDKMNQLLEKTFTSGRKVSIGVKCLSPERNGVYGIQSRKNLLEHLLSLKKYLDKCSYFIIERQFVSFRRGNKSVNMIAMEVAETTLSLLLEMYPDRNFMKFPSGKKTQMIGIPFRQNTNDGRKKWAIDKCRMISELRQDQSLLDIFNLKDDMFRKRMNPDKEKELIEKYPHVDHELATKIVSERQKLDDIFDAMLQCQAFKILVLITKQHSGCDI